MKKFPTATDVNCSFPILFSPFAKGRNDFPWIEKHSRESRNAISARSRGLLLLPWKSRCVPHEIEIALHEAGNMKTFSKVLRKYIKVIEARTLFYVLVKGEPFAKELLGIVEAAVEQ